jgi:hypothetical protein
MSLWTSSLMILLLLQSVQSQAQQANVDARPLVIEETTGSSEELPPRLVFTNKGWDLTRAYSDVFEILSHQNSCSNFYGGPRTATTVLNNFVMLVKPQSFRREVSFQMGGQQRYIHDAATGKVYRLFDTTLVNTNGSFYQPRLDHIRRFPSDVGSFFPGSRPARALILLHELGT